ncbi:hypothetical protein FCMLKIFP_00039 [Pseudomonas phage Ka3]|nr:hypothetical protein FCMLKIFP_00039 [Pseudomonas phage Ka3]
MSDPIPRGVLMHYAYLTLLSRKATKERNWEEWYSISGFQVSLEKCHNFTLNHYDLREVMRDLST